GPWTSRETNRTPRNEELQSTNEELETCKEGPRQPPLEHLCSHHHGGIRPPRPSRDPGHGTSLERRLPAPGGRSGGTTPPPPRCRTCSGAESLRTSLSSKVSTCQNC